MKKTLKEIGRDAQSDFRIAQQGMPDEAGSYDRERLEHALRSAARTHRLPRLKETGFLVVTLKEYKKEGRRLEKPLDDLWRDQLRMEPTIDLATLNWEEYMV